MITREQLIARADGYLTGEFDPLPDDEVKAMRDLLEQDAAALAASPASPITEGVRDALVTARDALVDCAQFMDGVKPRAIAEGWWSEWDAVTRDKITVALTAATALHNPSPKGGQQPTEGEADWIARAERTGGEIDAAEVEFFRELREQPTEAQPATIAGATKPERDSSNPQSGSSPTAGEGQPTTAANRTEPLQSRSGPPSARATSPAQEGEWVLVPREPDEAMRKAGIDASPMWLMALNAAGDAAPVPASHYRRQRQSLTTDDCAEIYRAMLSAAPQPLATPPAQDGPL